MTFSVATKGVVGCSFHDEGSSQNDSLVFFGVSCGNPLWKSSLLLLPILVLIHILGDLLLANIRSQRLNNRP